METGLGCKIHINYNGCNILFHSGKKFSMCHILRNIFICDYMSSEYLCMCVHVHVYN